MWIERSSSKTNFFFSRLKFYILEKYLSTRIQHLFGLCYLYDVQFQSKQNLNAYLHFQQHHPLCQCPNLIPMVRHILKEELFYGLSMHPTQRYVLCSFQENNQLYQLTTKNLLRIRKCFDFKNEKKRSLIEQLPSTQPSFEFCRASLLK